MTLSYFDTLYQRMATLSIEGPITFIGTHIAFYNMGRKERIELKDMDEIRSTNPLQITYYSLNYNTPVSLAVVRTITFGIYGICYTTADNLKGSMEYSKVMSIQEV